MLGTGRRVDARLGAAAALIIGGFVLVPGADVARVAAFVVDTTIDGADETPGDGACASAAAGGCSLAPPSKKPALWTAPTS